MATSDRGYANIDRQRKVTRGAHANEVHRTSMIGHSDYRIIDT